MGTPGKTGVKLSIDDVRFAPRRIIPTEGGPVLKYLAVGDEDLAGSAWGEIYFSEVSAGAVKAWKRHLRTTQRVAVPVGRVRFVVVDQRGQSATKGQIVDLVLGRDDNYGVLTIPPMLWYGFAGLGPGPSLVVNSPDRPHDPGESESQPIPKSGLPAVW